jgi:DNA-binding transcriptional regulator GbsR (MarR family)
MSSKAHSQQLQKLAEQIGNFIEYWGFKKIHGMIWTHLYLSPAPLSAQDLIQRLRVSKALISLSMKDLLEYQLILQTDESLSKKNKFYTANPEVFEVIRGVLEMRELQMMARISSEFKILQDLQKNTTGDLIQADRFTALGEMIEGGRTGLQHLIDLSKVDPRFLSAVDQ